MQSLTANAIQNRPLRERIGVYIQASDTVNAITQIREAEQAGIQQIWMAMGGAGFADILTVLAAAASQTDQIGMGTAIVPTYPRHPLVMAQQALAIHDLAPGRLRLGIGSGNPAFLGSRYGLPQNAPLSHLKEYLEVLRGVLWEGNVDHKGKFFQVTDTLPRKAPVPLLISALGLKAFRLAGEAADGALAALCPVPYLLEQALPALRAGAEEKSRPAPPIIASLPVVFSSDEATVTASARRLIQQLITGEAHGRMFRQAGWSAAVDGDDAALNALAQELVISGSEEAVRDQIQALLANGVDELMVMGIPVADANKERQQLIEVIGSF